MKTSYLFIALSLSAFIMLSAVPLHAQDNKKKPTPTGKSKESKPAKPAQTRTKATPTNPGKTDQPPMKPKK